MIRYHADLQHAEVCSAQIERKIADEQTRFFRLTREQIAELVNPHGFEFDAHCYWWAKADAWDEYEAILRDQLRAAEKEAQS